MTETPQSPAVAGTVVAALYRAHVRPLFAFIYSKVGNRAAAAALSLRLLDGLSVAETAQRMGLSTNYAKVLQHRALKAAARHDMIGYDHGMGRPDRQAGRGLASVAAPPIAVQRGRDV